MYSINYVLSKSILGKNNHQEQMMIMQFKERIKNEFLIYDLETYVTTRLDNEYLGTLLQYFACKLSPNIREFFFEKNKENISYLEMFTQFSVKDDSIQSQIEKTFRHMYKILSRHDFLILIYLLGIIA
ncbi:hypothetical protein ACFSTE_19890 [Aquimarina hainanensis]|uniref:Uncharacterized protein n=1 Tax=Aquimarina hainanensis TaxID=1578017 RepID=A0ABW5NCD5_9FLAO|nr:hypothetical protein [Aquimarina sp. TRL1]QKX06415.1 hypothetical protein HN014_16350 [Aquimarina sp. TRL1]